MFLPQNPMGPRAERSQMNSAKNLRSWLYRLCVVISAKVPGFWLFDLVHWLTHCPSKTYVYRSIYLFFSIYLFVCLSIHLSIYLSINLSVSLFVNLSVYFSLSLYLSISLSLYLSISLSLYLSISLSLYLSIPLSIHPSIHPSIHLSIYLSIYCFFIFFRQTERQRDNEVMRPWETEADRQRQRQRQTQTDKQSWCDPLFAVVLIDLSWRWCRSPRCLGGSEAFLVHEVVPGQASLARSSQNHLQHWHWGTRDGPVDRYSTWCSSEFGPAILFVRHASFAASWSADIRRSTDVGSGARKLIATPEKICKSKDADFVRPNVCQSCMCILQSWALVLTFAIDKGGFGETVSTEKRLNEPEMHDDLSTTNERITSQEEIPLNVWNVIGRHGGNRGPKKS